jgi:phosphotransferase system HPr (HPr) family protein
MAYTAQVTVLDPIGLHARPAGQIAKLVKESGLEVKIGPDASELVAGGSALRLMAMKATTGSELTVVVETDDDAAGAAIVDQIQEFLKG